VQREQLHAFVGAQLPTSGNTLHRLLGYTPWNEQFRHHAGNPLPHDVIIVDEASMVDVLMMDALFSAVKADARVIVLGDPDQLASVDTGFVLGDVARAAQPAHDAPSA
jgi:exodeoxyribonuclease V alpha subunit